MFRPSLSTRKKFKNSCGPLHDASLSLHTYLLYLCLVCLLNNINGVLSSDKTVFIWGGVRALERLAVQLCAAWGARVTCVAPRYTHEYLLSLGAAYVVADDMEEVERVARSGQRWADIFRHTLCT